MRIQTLSPSFSGIKTVVYYKWSSFIPTNSERITDHDKEALIKVHGSSEFYYSGGNSSDFLTFSEYDFKLNPEKEDLRGFVKSNYFDSETLNQAKDGGKYNQDILVNFEDYLLPQISNEDYDESKKFFGTLINESYSVIYLDIPGEENSSPIWMVELYDSYIETNHSISEKTKDFPFISYKLLELISSPEKISHKPNYIITFGPEDNYINNFGENQDDYSFYYKNNLEYYLTKSSDYIKISEKEWASLFREITSKEILKIVISSEGLLSQVINLSRLSWDISSNPNRNQNKYSLRNDEFWATRDFYKVDNESEILKDIRSGTIIATKKLSNTDSLPILSSKLALLGKRYSARKVYKESETVLVNDYIYSSLISGNLGENPTYSNYWKQIEPYKLGDEDKYVDNYLESLSLLRNNLSGDYYQAYIHTNNKAFGRVSPQGQQYFRKGSNQKIYIYPNAGYEITELIVYSNGRRVSSQKKKLSFVEDKMAYLYEFPSNIESSIDIKVIFSKQQGGIVLYSLSGVNDNTEIRISSLSDIEVHTTGKNQESGIKVTFDDEINISEKGELIFNENTVFPVVMHVSDDLSPYSFSGISVKGKENTTGLLQVDISNDSKKVIFYDNNESLNIVFNVHPKKLNCQIKPDNGVEVSSLGSYVDYSNGYSISFAMINENDQPELVFDFGSYPDPEIISNLGDFQINNLNKQTLLDGNLNNTNGIYILSINQLYSSVNIYIRQVNINN